MRRIFSLWETKPIINDVYIKNDLKDDLFVLADIYDSDHSLGICDHVML